MRSTEIVNAFWEDVWNEHAPDAVDRFVADDVVIERVSTVMLGGDLAEGLSQMIGLLQCNDHAIPAIVVTSPGVPRSVRGAS